MWTISNLLGKSRTSVRIGKFLRKDVDLGKPTSFLYHVHLGCTQRECQSSKDIVEICRSMCESRFPPGLQKNCQKQKQRWNLMPKHHLHGPMTWKANKTPEQIFEVPTPYMDDHQFKEDEDGSVGELSTVCSQIVVKCLYLARVWETRYFVVCEQACSCGYEKDRSLWQTLSTFDLLHWQHCFVGHIRIVPRLWFCRRSGRLEINIRWALVHFGESHVRTSKLDVQETDISFTRFNRDCSYFSWCRFTYGRHSRSHSGIWWLKFFIPNRTE